MSEPYEIAALQPEPLPIPDAIARVHALLSSWDIELCEDSALVLHDWGDTEPECEPISDAATALRRIIEWPSLGTLDYGGPEGMVTVSYLLETGRRGLQCVLLSALPRAVERTNGIPRYQAFAAALHDQLPARRTIMAWGLEAFGFVWRDELERLRAGAFQASYDLLDLRRE